MIRMRDLTQFARTIRDPCIGKRRHATYADAEAEIGRLIRKQVARPQQGTLNPYYCRQCRHWHLGHLRDAPSRRRRK